MVIHPLIVHFPVALLSLYCGIEVFTTFWFKNNPSLAFTKKLLLWVGTLTVFMSLGTGEGAAEAYGSSAIIHLHENFADICTAVFSVISAIYLLDIPMNTLTQKYLSPRLISQLSSISQKLQLWKVPVILAVIGFLILSAVGAVGGSITRGTDNDPIAKYLIDHFASSTEMP